MKYFLSAANQFLIASRDSRPVRSTVRTDNVTRYNCLVYIVYGLQVHEIKYVPNQDLGLNYYFNF